MTRKMITLHEDMSTFMVLSLSMRVRIRNISDKFGMKLESHIYIQLLSFRKSCLLCGNVENIVRSGSQKK